jgi:ParB-like chromosome segregation protein Spo0J
MKIEQRKVESLIPYVNNSRKHSDEQVAQIAASIKEFGWTNPILVDGDNGIIAGHGRLMAARKLEMDKIPVIELAHLTEHQRKALIIADNKLGLNSSWDEQLLMLEIENLKEADFNIDILGFDPSELKSVDVDYSLLDDEKIDDQLADMEKGVRKAIQIEFELEHYEEATELVKWWRDQHAYVGMMLVDHLREEKRKHFES